MGANAYLNERERNLLENAVVGIAGAGGLGSNCAMHLARSGVKKFVIADFDTVNESNLNRQFFFRDQIGRKKVDALAENLRRIEPDLELELHDTRLDPGNIGEIFSRCTAFVEALDSASAKAMFLRAVIPSGKPVASASGLAGWGRSGGIVQRRIGKNLVLAGDTARGVGGENFPFSPRVGIAAAMEANAIVAMILGEEP